MLLQNSLNEKLSKKGNRRRRKYLMNPPPATAGCLARTAHKVLSMVRWVFDDFLLGHLVWIKLIFLFQSASMTVLYPYINLHMKVGLETIMVLLIWMIRNTLPQCNITYFEHHQSTGTGVLF